jgi:hypothetical protein
LQPLGELPRQPIERLAELGKRWRRSRIGLNDPVDARLPELRIVPKRLAQQPLPAVPHHGVA